MNNNIILVHNYYFDPDSKDEINNIKTIISIENNKMIINNQYITLDEEYIIKENVKIIDIESSDIKEILDIDLSGLKNNYYTKDELESWEISINNKKIIGTYDKLPKEIFDIMNKVNFFEIIRSENNKKWQLED